MTKARCSMLFQHVTASNSQEVSLYYWQRSQRPHKENTWTRLINPRDKQYGLTVNVRVTADGIRKTLVQGMGMKSTC